MPQTDIDAAQVGDMTNKVTDIEVPSVDTDGATGQQETTWQNTKWSQWLGYYKAVPEVKTAIDMRAIWTLGKGYKADVRTTVILDHISGWGMDSFNSILKNMIVTRRVGGDAYAEIIREKDKLINLKPLDPGTIVIVVNKQGMLLSQA